MYTDFGRWKLEDQPAVTGVHMREPENVAKEGPIGLRVLAVNDHMRAVDHDYSDQYR
jgi:hypothetical protein